MLSESLFGGAAWKVSRTAGKYLVAGRPGRNRVRRPSDASRTNLRAGNIGLKGQVYPSEELAGRPYCRAAQGKTFAKHGRFSGRSRQYVKVFRSNGTGQCGQSGKSAAIMFLLDDPVPDGPQTKGETPPCGPGGRRAGQWRWGGKWKSSKRQSRKRGLCWRIA